MLNVTRVLGGFALVALAVTISGGRLSATHDRTQGGNAKPGQPATSTAVPGQSGGESRRGGQGRGPGQDVRPWMWWKDAAMAQEVGLTPSQVGKIDRIFEKRQVEIKAKVDDYNRQKAELDRLMAERTVKAEEIEAQARRMTYPQLDIMVSRTRMLYEMSLVMSAEQNARMSAMFDRFDQERRAAMEKLERERARGRRGGGNSPRQ